MEAASKRTVLVLVAVHTALLTLYTFPPALVPEKLRIVGQLYARPLFHQQWRLFAPDPPLCSCTIECSTGGRWFALSSDPDHYLQRRAAQSIARHVQAEVAAGRSRPSPQLIHAMRAMAQHGNEWRAGYPLPEFRFRLVEHCVTDAHRPWLREERITELAVP